MIGVILATHGDLGSALIASMEMITGPQPGVAAVALQVADRIEEATTRLQEALEAVDDGEGVLVLTDMLGGTPSNLCLTLMGGERPVEVVSGVNLPMLIKAANARREADLHETAVQTRRTGQSAIRVASEVLEGGERGGGGGAA